MKKRILAVLMLSVVTMGICFATESETISDALQTVRSGSETTQSEPVAENEAQTPAAEDETATVYASKPVYTPQDAIDNINEQNKNQESVQKMQATPENPGAATAIAFGSVDATVRADNFSIQANKETLAALESMNANDVTGAYGWQYIGLQTQYNTLNDLYLSVDETQINGPELKGYIYYSMQSLLVSMQSIDQQIDAIEDDEDEYFNRSDVRRQLSYAEDATVNGVETLYIAIATQKQNLVDAQRGLATLDRSITEMETRHTLGQVATLQLEQLKSQRESTASSIQSLSFAIDQLESDLAVQLGWELSTSASVSELPTVTGGQLSSMNFQNDLKDAVANSYTVWQAENALDDAQNQYEDDVAGSTHNVTAAKISLENSQRSTTQAFRKLFQNVQDKKRLVDAAQDTYTMQQKTYQAEETKYGLGKISKNALLSAEDDLDAAASAVTAAQIQLFSAYNQYRWAVRGVMGS